MKQYSRNPIEVELERRERRKEESAAKTVPYISFILTHVALVLFIAALFIVDRLVTNAQINLIVKVLLVVIAVLFLASEWGYAILSSYRWRKNLRALQASEEEKKQIEELAHRRMQESLIISEREKRLALQFELHQRRRQEGAIELQRSNGTDPRLPPLTGQNVAYPNKRMNGATTELRRSTKAWDNPTR